MRKTIMVIGLLLGCSSVASANTVDLTTVGSSGTINGGLFQQIFFQPAGTGVIDPFVRIQANGTEQGYNTDGSPFQFDEKAGIWTHSLLLTDVPIVTINGIQYREFLLDINEPNADVTTLLSLDDLDLFLGNAPDLLNYPTFNGDAVQVWDLDGIEASRVELNYDLNAGSGVADMAFYVPNAVFSVSSNPWVYLYSSFGNPNTSGDGFEEWWVRTADNPPPIPEPATMLLFGTGLAALAGARRRMRKQ